MEEEIRERIAALEDDVRRLEREARERELKRLKWGVSALGTVAMAMAAWIWSQIGHLFNLGVK